MYIITLLAKHPRQRATVFFHHRRPLRSSPEIATAIRAADRPKAIGITRTVVSILSVRPRHLEKGNHTLQKLTLAHNSCAMEEIGARFCPVSTLAISHKYQGTRMIATVAAFQKP